jgi:hypothetical protein
MENISVHSFNIPRLLSFSKAQKPVFCREDYWNQGKLVWKQEIHPYFEKSDRECIRMIILLSSKRHSIFYRLPRDMVILIIKSTFILLGRDPYFPSLENIYKKYPGSTFHSLWHNE